MIDEKIDNIIKKFLDKKMDKKNLIGILITGSYAKNIQRKNSDLDLLLISKSKTKFRERGNVVVGGIMIEYYLNTAQQIRKYFEIDKDQNNPMIFFSILEGKILFEKYKILTKLKAEAEKLINTPYTDSPSNYIEFSKYIIADTLNKMESLFDKKSDSFSFSYYLSIKMIYDIYAKFVHQPILKDYMLEDYFKENKRFGKIISNFPDRKFASIFHSALITKRDSEKIRIYIELSKYVLDRMGGFKLNGWKLVLPVNYSNKKNERNRIF